MFDRHDQLVGSKERTAIGRDEIYRVTALWLTNSKGDVLLAKRALKKRQGAGKWGPAVTGTVEKGESYLENMLREIQEELGVVSIQVVPGMKELVERDTTYFLQWFYGKMDEPACNFRIAYEEVAEVRWFTVTELRGALRHTPDLFISAVGRFLNF